MTFKKQMLGLVISSLLFTTTSIGVNNYITNKDSMELAVSEFQVQERQARELLIQSMAEGAKLAVEAALDTGVSKEAALESYANTFGTLNYGEGGYFFILDSHGVFVHHPQKEFIGRDMSDWADAKGNFVTKLLNGAAKRDGWTSYWWPKVSGGEAFEKISFAKQISGTDWVVGTGLYIDDIEEKVSTMRAESESSLKSELLSQLLFSLAILFGLSFLSSMLINKTTNPLDNVRAKIAELSKGQGDLTIRLNDQEGGDEIRALSASFNTFMDYLNNVIRSISEASGGVASISGELSVLSEKLNHQLNAHHAQTETVSASITQMSASSAQVAGSARNVSESTDEATSKSRTAMGAVKDSDVVVDQLMSGMKLSAGHIAELSEHSKQIHIMLESINSIADQTNLLALNAAIEAARAGEQGRGFAVVADEVRALAGRSSEATEDIAKLLSVLDNLVKTALDSMSDSEGKTHETVEISGVIGQELTHISEQIENISMMTSEIATASTQQSQAVHEVNESINNTQEVVREIKTVSDDTIEIVGRLKGSGEALEAVVSGFKTS